LAGWKFGFKNPDFDFGKFITNLLSALIVGGHAALGIDVDFSQHSVLVDLLAGVGGTELVQKLGFSVLPSFVQKLANVASGKKE